MEPSTGTIVVRISMNGFEIPVNLVYIATTTDDGPTSYLVTDRFLDLDVYNALSIEDARIALQEGEELFREQCRQHGGAV